MSEGEKDVADSQANALGDIPELNILFGDAQGERKETKLNQVNVSGVVSETGVKLLPIAERGVYILDESELTDEEKQLLHYRAYVADNESLNGYNSSNPITYYIAYDQVQGLVVPARSLSINCEGGDAHYRWTDDGEHWTGWITLGNGMTDSYLPSTNNRFAEVQVYADSTGVLISLRALR